MRERGKDEMPKGPIEWIAQVVGVFAITVFLLSYQQKERKKIILWNAVSRVLYILQYCLLLSFDGAILDVLGILSSVLAGRRDTGFVGRHRLLLFLLTDAAMVGATLLLWQDIFSLLALVGVLFQTSAFWIRDEKIIRRLSLAGCPAWFAFNFTQKAYPSAVGDAMSALSILIAMWRYDRKKCKEI